MPSTLEAALQIRVREAWAWVILALLPPTGVGLVRNPQPSPPGEGDISLVVGPSNPS